MSKGAGNRQRKGKRSEAAWAGLWTRDQGHRVLILVLPGLEQLLPGNENDKLNVTSVPITVLWVLYQLSHLMSTAMVNAYHIQSWLY